MAARGSLKGIHDRDWMRAERNANGRIARLYCRACPHFERLTEFYRDGDNPGNPYQRARGAMVEHFASEHRMLWVGLNGDRPGETIAALQIMRKVEGA